MGRRERQAEAALRYLNSIVSRVSLDPLPEDIEDRVRGWRRLVEHYSERECDECRRVAPADYDWLFSLAFAPFLDPQKVLGLEGRDKRMFVDAGRGLLWIIRQSCEDCAAEREEVAS